MYKGIPCASEITACVIISLGIELCSSDSDMLMSLSFEESSLVIYKKSLPEFAELRPISTLVIYLCSSQSIIQLTFHIIKVHH